MKEREVEELQGILCSPEGGSEACVIMSHGLFGSMYSPKYVELSEELSRRGLSSLRFNYGEEEGKQMGIFRRVEKLGKAVESARSLGYRRIGLMGSSLGGGVALLFSLREDVRALAAWATPCRLEGLPKVEGLEELEREAGEYDLLESVRRLRTPLLLVHGTEDELVPLRHSLELFERAPHPKVLLTVEGADHRFTGERERRTAVEFTAEWLERRLLRP